jgi:hypothetical protein
MRAGRSWCRESLNLNLSVIFVFIVVCRCGNSCCGSSLLIAITFALHTYTANLTSGKEVFMNF